MHRTDLSRGTSFSLPARDNGSRGMVVRGHLPQSAKVVTQDSIDRWASRDSTAGHGLHGDIAITLCN